MGVVFNIQHFSIHDGPGIRTVVFLKGCPLRCKWCSNPESQSRGPQLAWTKGMCISCGACTSELSDISMRFEEDRLLWDTDSTLDADRVKGLCPSQALHLIGKDMSIDEVIDEISRDAPFFTSSGGGMTLSGGEPLSQADFAYDLLVEAKKRGIHRTIETSSHATWDIYKKVMSQVDYLITDIKHMDDDIHKKWTGVSNKIILDNITRLREEYRDLNIHIRTPVIPGVNDSLEVIGEIIDLAISLDANYELLRYHTYGISKYESLNRSYPMDDASLSDEHFQALETAAIKRYSKAKSNAFYGPPALYKGVASSREDLIDGAGI